MSVIDDPTNFPEYWNELATGTFKDQVNAAVVGLDDVVFQSATRAADQVPLGRAGLRHELLQPVRRGRARRRHVEGHPRVHVPGLRPRRHVLLVNHGRICPSVRPAAPRLRTGVNTAQLARRIDASSWVGGAATVGARSGRREESLMTLTENPFLAGNYGPVSDETTATDLARRSGRSRPSCRVGTCAPARTRTAGRRAVPLVHRRRHGARRRPPRRPRRRGTATAGCAPTRSRRRWVANRSSGPAPPMYDSSNTNVLEHAGRIFVAHRRRDARTSCRASSTRCGRTDFGGPLPSGLTAHPKIDPGHRRAARVLVLVRRAVPHLPPDRRERSARAQRADHVAAVGDDARLRDHAQSTSCSSTYRSCSTSPMRAVPVPLGRRYAGARRRDAA